MTTIFQLLNNKVEIFFPLFLLSPHPARAETRSQDTFVLRKREREKSLSLFTSQRRAKVGQNPKAELSVHSLGFDTFRGLALECQQASGWARILQPPEILATNRLLVFCLFPSGEILNGKRMSFQKVGRPPHPHQPPRSAARPLSQTQAAALRCPLPASGILKGARNSQLTDIETPDPTSYLHVVCDLFGSQLNLPTQFPELTGSGPGVQPGQ